MKESYRREQKRRIKELSSALKDPSVIILSSWLKVKLCSLIFSEKSVTFPKFFLLDDLDFCVIFF